MSSALIHPFHRVEPGDKILVQQGREQIKGSLVTIDPFAFTFTFLPEGQSTPITHVEMDSLLNILSPEVFPKEGQLVRLRRHLMFSRMTRNIRDWTAQVMRCCEDYISVRLCQDPEPVEIILYPGDYTTLG